MIARSITDAVSAPAWNTDELGEINTTFRNRPAEDLLGWAAERFGQQVVLTCSFGGASGMALLDMVARGGRSTPVIFLDTDLLFPETYALAEAAARRYGVTIQRQRPVLTLAEQEGQEGAKLYEREPGRCCGLRTRTPLDDAQRPYRAWISGIRRDQSSTRAATELVQWSARHNLLKV